MADWNKNSVHEMDITGYTAEGMGVARLEGRVVFVPNTIRGERWQVQLLKVNKTVAWGRGVKPVLESPCRVPSDCPHSGPCGGCQFRHMDYSEELEAKRLRVEDALRRIGGVDITVDTIHGAADTHRYRNKVQFPVAQGKHGVHVGLFRARSHDVIDVPDCLLQSEQANRLGRALKGWMERGKIPAYDEKSGRGLVRHLYVRTNRAGESLACVVVNGKKLPHEMGLVRELRACDPGLVGVVLNVNDKDTNVILGDRYRTLWGRDWLEEELCALTFRLSVPSFFQINREQTQVLYSRAVEFAALTGKETVLDLYCGIGTISLAMAQKAGTVIGAEIVPEAIEDARENAKRNGVTNAEFFCGDAGDIAQKLAAEGARPDVICVDPPRKGLAPGVTDILADMVPERIVYVSCDPATLARDVKRLGELGYEVRCAEAVDLFPRTQHVETVVLLSREKRNEPNRNFRMARQGDAEHVLSLYQSAKSGEFCVWSDSYPTIAEIEHDLETKNLYVMTHGSKIVGAISVVPENELDSFDCWSCKDSKEIARVVIAKAYQGQGLSFEMVQSIESILRRNGYTAIHLSVAKSNIPAYKTYIKAGFIAVGEADMYGSSYYLMEKAIDTNSPPNQTTLEGVVCVCR